MQYTHIHKQTHILNHRLRNKYPKCSHIASFHACKTSCWRVIDCVAWFILFFPFIHWKFKFMEHCCSACTVHTFIVWSILLINIFIAVREVRTSIERRQPSSKNNNLINVAVALFLLFLFFGHVMLLFRYSLLSIDFEQ